MKFPVENKLFFFCLIAVIFVIVVIIFISAITPSSEEFIEVYWELYSTENLMKKTHVSCNAEKCSKSGVYRVGSIRLNDVDYGFVLFDTETPFYYASLCVDFNQNEIYCDEGEGPMNIDSTFSIDTKFFSVLNLEEDRVAIAHFPKDLTVQDFTVGFIIESHYTDTVNLDINLLVNETLKESKKLLMGPGQKIIQDFTVSLSEDGLYKIKVSVFVLPGDEEVFIDFWVNKNSSL